MEQIGPSTHEFAEARKLSRTVGDEMMERFKKETGGTESYVRATILMVGLKSLGDMRAAAGKLFPNKPKAADLLLELIMLGYGWSALTAFYELTLDYTKMLDELNGMKVMDDNDLPPAKEKG